MTSKLSPQMHRVLEAMRNGASLRYIGWQQVDVYWPNQPGGFVARQQTLYALRDRGLITLGRDGVHLTDAGRGA